MYQDQLCEAVRFLNETEIKLHEIMLNLMMTGERRNWDKMSPLDEVITIDNSLFEASKDPNICTVLNL